ncbi:hypothetical protein [Streptomyces sp. MspMP-M5]|uniref:hypothetical protein n=1 Tax=Streptomyces sp. MspMP-M5 TaxID=1155718 RepID=UPI003B631E02
MACTLAAEPDAPLCDEVTSTRARPGHRRGSHGSAGSDQDRPRADARRRQP